MQRQLGFFDYLINNQGHDWVESMFVDYLEDSSRAAFARTTQGAAAFFDLHIERAVRSDFRKALLAMGYKLDSSINLAEISTKQALQFMDILKANYTLLGDKRRFIAWVYSESIQSDQSIAFWRVAIFCVLTIMGLELNRPDIGHSFVTEANLTIFKNLVVRLRQFGETYPQDMRRAYGPVSSAEENFVGALDACCDVLVSAGEAALSQLLKDYKNENYYSWTTVAGTSLLYADQRRREFVVDIQTSTQTFIADIDVKTADLIQLEYLLTNKFGTDLIELLARLHRMDKRGAKWIIKMLGTMTLENLHALRSIEHDDSPFCLMSSAKAIQDGCPSVTLASFEGHAESGADKVKQIHRGAIRALIHYASKHVTTLSQLKRLIKLFEEKKFIGAIILASRKCYIMNDPYDYRYYGQCAAILIVLFSRWNPSNITTIDDAVLNTFVETAVRLQRDWNGWRWDQAHNVFDQHLEDTFRPDSLLWRLSPAVRDSLVQADKFPVQHSPFESIPPDGLLWSDLSLLYHLSVDERAIQRLAELGESAFLLNRYFALFARHPDVSNRHNISYLNIVLKLPEAVFVQALAECRAEFERWERDKNLPVSDFTTILVSRLCVIPNFNTTVKLLKNPSWYYYILLHPDFFIRMFDHCDVNDISLLTRPTGGELSVENHLYYDLLSTIMHIFAFTMSPPRNASANGDSYISREDALQLIWHIASAHNEQIIDFIKRCQYVDVLIANRAEIIELAKRTTKRSAVPEQVVSVQGMKRLREDDGNDDGGFVAKKAKR